MIKNSIKYALLFSVLLIVGYSLHSYLIANSSILLPFSLLNVYCFHAVISFLICVGFEVFSRQQKYHDQLGFIYLGALVFKIIVFSIVFNKVLFAEQNLSKTESVSLLIPLAIFLVTEVYFITQVLNRKHSDRIK
jgi:hypothetical protein